MKREKTLSIVLPILVAVITFALIGLAYVNFNSKNKNTSVVHAVELKKKEIDISKVTVSKEMEDEIKKSDTKNSDKNIKNYKTLIAKLDVPEKYRNEVDRLIKAGYKVSDTLTAYEFLNENYGQMKDLEQLLGKNKSEKNWSKVFEEYKKNNKDFKPQNFDSKTLDEVMNIPGINQDDIMNADRISQMGIKSFKELIEMRKNGKTWKEINSELEILNVSEKLPTATVDDFLVEKLCKEKNMQKNQVIEALILAAKTDMNDEEVVKLLKDGKSKEYIYAKYYDCLYK
jgi:hypothetical protein